MRKSTLRALDRIWLGLHADPRAVVGIGEAWAVRHLQRNDDTGRRVQSGRGAGMLWRAKEVNVYGRTDLSHRKRRNDAADSRRDGYDQGSNRAATNSTHATHFHPPNRAARPGAGFVVDAVHLHPPRNTPGNGDAYS